jgi:hypothetical protein
MAHIEWLQLCDTAFLDNRDRLCVISVINRFPVPVLPIAVHQLTLVASGLSPSPDDPQCIDIAKAGEYVLVTLRQFPLPEEGMYRFTVSLVSGNSLSLDIPVLIISRPAHLQIH